MIHEIMQKIIALPGWSWEWKFGDRVYDVSEDHECLVIGIDNPEKLYVAYPRNGDDPDLQEFSRLHYIPLPSVEQWIPIFKERGFSLTTNSYGDLKPTAISSKLDDADSRKSVVGDDIGCACAILYARVVLGYKFDGKEFGKC